jgi:hypothetical protein
MTLKINQIYKFIINGSLNDIDIINESVNVSFENINNKFYYTLKFSNDNLNNFYDFNKLEGIKGFKQHIISNDIFNIVIKEKYNSLEITTFNNKLFIYGKLIH